MFHMALALLLASTPGGNPAPASLSHSDLTPVRLILNRDDFNPGDPVRVQVETGADGYLLVLRVDGDGRVRVLFPLDPDLDPFVRGNRRYELRGRNESETFSADDLGGAGMVFAALSLDPLDFTGFAVGGHWDYETLRLDNLPADPEAALHRVVREMSRQGRYNFDVKSYRVYSISSTWPSTTLVSHVGVRDPYRCLSCGTGWYGGGLHLGISVGADPWNRWYDPFWYDPYWYPVAYPIYRADPWWGYDPWYSPYYPGQYRPYTVINYRPRTVVNLHAGERSRPRVAVAPRLGAVSGVLTTGGRPAQVQRPAAPPPAVQTRARPRQVPPQQGSVAPPAQRTPPAQQVDRSQGRATAADQGRSAPPAQSSGSSGNSTTPPRARQAPPTSTSGGGNTGSGGRSNSTQQQGSTRGGNPPAAAPQRGTAPPASAPRRVVEPPQTGRQAIVVTPGRGRDNGSTVSRPVPSQQTGTPPASVSRPVPSQQSGRPPASVSRPVPPASNGRVTAPPPTRADQPPVRRAPPAPPPRTVSAPPPSSPPAATRSAPPAAPPVRAAPPPARTVPPPNTGSSGGTQTRARGGGR